MCCLGNLVFAGFCEFDCCYFVLYGYVWLDGLRVDTALLVVLLPIGCTDCFWVCGDGGLQCFILV